MKYIGALVFSIICFLILIGKSIDVNLWHKILYNKEDSKEKKKWDFKICIIIWIIITISLFVYAYLN